MVKEDISLLREAFDSFNRAVDRLSSSYSELERKVAQLKEELARENAEKEKLRGYLESILNSIDLGVIAVNVEGRVIFFNRAAGEILGLDPQKAVGRSCSSVLGLDSPLEETLRNTRRRTFDDELINPEENGEPIKVEITTSPMWDEHGKVIGAVEVIKDISERKMLEEQIRRSETLSALGEMAAQVVHEIRNPLGAIQLYVGILQRELSGDQKKLADDIASGLRSIEIITSNLLALARPIKPSFREVDILALLEEVITFAIYAIEENGIKLIRDYPECGLICHVDPEQIKQVALNLILNAIQAMPEGGVLRISASKGDRIKLEFEDTGVGIPQEHLDKIFNPFFSTKSTGTGLGLYTVDKILRAHGASIRVKSQVGVGTCFLIEIPEVIKGEQR
ncbi:TPA: PAS domain-containing protein [Candidatus Poribacteria bacterium]|nr:PAS domain-containing protein [Candidatus Poribacteria bacterium]HEX29477.1 PAS domain-containing protein [Candidatus Poribacteria bacterium]